MAACATSPFAFWVADRRRIAPGPGQESVWDYPRPPRLEHTSRLLVIVLGGQTIVETRGAYRVLETSHPPSYYLPPEDILDGALVPAEGSSYCEWKGGASYYDVHGGDRIARRAAWYYPSPTGPFGPIAGHVAFYPAAMDGCFVDGERVTPQDGGFYGGWVTPDIVGPIKGGPGTHGW